MYKYLNAQKYRSVSIFYHILIISHIGVVPQQCTVDAVVSPFFSFRKSKPSQSWFTGKSPKFRCSKIPVRQSPCLLLSPMYDTPAIPAFLLVFARKKRMASSSIVSGARTNGSLWRSVET